MLVGADVLYLAVNRQGPIVYKFPYMSPVVDRVIFSLAALLEFFEHHLADMREKICIMYTKKVEPPVSFDLLQSPGLSRIAPIMWHV